MLAKPQFDHVETERKNYKASRKRNPQWYELFSGPSNLERLSHYVKRGAEYEMFYRTWSATTHASDLSRFVERLNQADPIVRVLRDFRDISHVSLYAASFLIIVTPLVLAKFHPGEKPTDWYKREVQDMYKKLMTTEYLKFTDQK